MHVLPFTNLLLTHIFKENGRKTIITYGVTMLVDILTSGEGYSIPSIIFITTYRDRLLFNNKELIDWFFHLASVKKYKDFLIQNNGS